MVYCALAVIVCFLLCTPLVDLPYGDEVSYSKTAWDLALTGRLIYNGWAAAMLGAQAYWGALFVGFFGFSFDILRMSMIPVGIGSACLMYALCRREKIPSESALFGTFTVLFMPVTIAFLPSFFTDMPGLFPLLATVFALTRATDYFGDWDAPATVFPRSPLLVWLTLAVVCGTLGGTIRQVIWLVIPAAILVWFIRERLWRRLKLLGVLLLFAGIQVLAANQMTHWFNEQPLVIDERQGEAVQYLLNVPFQRFPVVKTVMLQTLGVSFEILLTLILYLLPVFIATLPTMLRTFRPASSRQWVSVGITVSLTGIMAASVSNHTRLVWPWFGANVTEFFLSASIVLHHDPEHLRILPYWLCAALTVCAFGFFGLLIFVASETWFRRHARQGGMPTTDPSETSAVPRGGEAGPGARVLEPMLGFAALYLIAPVVKSFFLLSPWLLDRYVVLLMPVTVIGLLKWEQSVPEVRSFSSPLAVVAWAVWVVGAYYGVGLTHDFFSYLRAVSKGVNALKASGVSDTAIFAGFEHDAWVQITLAHSLNDRRVINKMPRYVLPKYDFPGKDVYHNWNMTPVIQPEYFVSLQRFDGFYDTQIPPQRVACWLLPFIRYVYVQRMPPPSPTSVVKPHVPKPAPK